MPAQISRKCVRHHRVCRHVVYDVYTQYTHLLKHVNTPRNYLSKKPPLRYFTSTSRQNRPILIFSIYKMYNDFPEYSLISIVFSVIMLNLVMVLIICRYCLSHRELCLHIFMKNADTTKKL